jgi:hypothetical protein
VDATSTPVVTRRPGRLYQPAERSFTITCSLGGFNDVKLEWYGTSTDDARDTFLEYLHKNDEFGIPGWPEYRTMGVRFYGQSKSLTFKTEWVAGFTVSNH